MTAGAFLPRWRFSVDEYHRMAETKILSKDARVELIEGEVIAMSPIGARHAAYVKKVSEAIRRVLDDTATLGVQDPVRLNEFSEPEPDISVLRQRDDFYTARHPDTESVFLLVEISDASVAYDRNVKLPLYARSDIPEVWLIDVAKNVIEVHTEPSDSSYKHTQTIARNTTL